MIQIKRKYHKWVSINWVVHNYCNYTCSYCTEYSNGGEIKSIPCFKENLKKLIHSFQQEGITHFLLKLTGGEPTYFSELKELIEVFNKLVPKENRHLTINTNLSRNLKYWKENYNLFDEIDVSVHMEYMNDNRYFEKIEFLQDKLSVSTRILMKKDNFERCLLFAQKIKTLDNYDIEYVPVWKALDGTGEWSDYSKEELKTLKLNINDKKTTTLKGFEGFRKTILVTKDGEEKLNINRIISTKQNKFKNWECHIYGNIFIDYRGEIYRSTCGQEKSIGNIFIEFTTKNLTKTTICKQEWCLCGSDIHNEKLNKIIV